MVKQFADSAAQRAQNGAGAIGVLVAYGTGTTNAAANGASTVAHNARDENGNAYLAANLRVVAFPTSNAGGLYQSAAVTATVIDIRSTGTSVPYMWFLFVVN